MTFFINTFRRYHGDGKATFESYDGEKCESLAEIAERFPDATVFSTAITHLTGIGFRMGFNFPVAQAMAMVAIANVDYNAGLSYAADCVEEIRKDAYSTGEFWLYVSDH